MSYVSLFLTLFIAFMPPSPSFLRVDSIRTIDDFGDLSCKDERPRLDNFLLELQNEPRNIGYIIAYGGRRSRRGEAQARLTRIKNYLVGERGLSEARLHLIDGGYRKELTIELYAFPPEARPPLASPTVDPSEVKLRPGRIKKVELSCVGKVR